MKTLNRVIGCIVLSIFASCELPILEPPGDCLIKPTAKFSVNQESCDLPCGVSITNQSTGGVEYCLYIDDVLKSSAESPGNVTFLTDGPHKIELKVKNENKCEDSMTQVIQVSNMSRFEKAYDLGALDVDPLGISELANGNFQVLFRQDSELKSILINNIGEALGAVKIIKDSITSIATTQNLSNGEFLLTGSISSTSRARVIKINSSQGIASSPKLGFLFKGSSSSSAAGGIVSSSGVFFVSGLSKIADNYLGYARINGNTTEKNETLQRPETKGYRCISVAQINSSSIYILAESISTGDAKVFDVSINGDYNNSFAVGTLKKPGKIIAIGGGKFAVIGKNASNAWQLYYINGGVVSTSPVNLTFTDVRDMIVQSGDILICGADVHNIVVARLAGAGTVPTYTSFSSSGNILKGIAIASSKNGGYIIAGQQQSGSKKSLYIVASK